MLRTKSYISNSFLWHWKSMIWKKQFKTKNKQKNTTHCLYAFIKVLLLHAVGGTLYILLLSAWVLLSATPSLGGPTSEMMGGACSLRYFTNIELVEFLICIYVSIQMYIYNFYIYYIYLCIYVYIYNLYYLNYILKNTLWNK